MIQISITVCIYSIAADVNKMNGRALDVEFTKSISGENENELGQGANLGEAEGQEKVEVKEEEEEGGGGNGLDDEEEEEEERIVDLGVTQTIARYWLGPNATLLKTIYLSMAINITISLSDSSSDLAVAIQLILKGELAWGVTIILVDYLPMWQVLFHSSTSKAWNRLEDPKEKTILCLILVFAPIAFPLLQLRWILNYHTKKRDVFDFLHQNSKLAELISGSVESPMQFVLLLIMYAYGKVPLPWSSSTIIKDSAGNQWNVGAVPGMVSLSLSGLTLIKNAVDSAEAKTSTELMMFASFSILTCVFRISGYTIAIITLREFSVVMFFCIALSSLSIIVRFDKMSRKGFSSLTTFIVGIFVPSAISEQPHLIQYPKININTKTSDKVRNRRILTGAIGFWAVPIVLVFIIALLLLILFDKEYKVSSDLILDNGTSKRCLQYLILVLVLPSGILSLIGATLMKREKLCRLYSGLLFLLAMASFSFAVGSIVHVFKGEN